MQASRCVRPGLVFIALASQWLRSGFVASSHWRHTCNHPCLVFIALASHYLRSCFVAASQWLHTGNPGVALALQALRCIRPGHVFIALASQWLRSGLVAASQWLHSGFAGVLAGLAGFTLPSSWPCVDCASFAVASLWPRSGFALATHAAIVLALCSLR